MQGTLDPLACFDCLALGAQLERHLGDSTEPELHMFSYLGCLLSLYAGRMVSEWGYRFVCTPDGAPYSPDLSYALKV